MDVFKIWNIEDTDLFRASDRILYGMILGGLISSNCVPISGGKSTLSVLDKHWQMFFDDFVDFILVFLVKGA